MAVKPVGLQGVRIGFKNFEGREGQYNRKGERSFAVFLEDRDVAEQLLAEGWNVKFPKTQDEVDPDAPTRDPYIQVTVGFDYYPPDVYLITNGKPTKLDESDIAMLDWAELENVDLILRPYEWSVNRNSGIKAYLKKGYFTIVADEFTEKYGF